MALRLKPETRARWRDYLVANGLYETSPSSWRPVPRSEPVLDITKPDTDMFINGYVD